MTIGDHVAEGRCGSCGHSLTPQWPVRRTFTKAPCLDCGNPLSTWTPAAIVESARQWTLANNRPPKSADWRRSAPEHPSATTVCVVFGTWNAMLAAARLAQRRAHSNPVWSKDSIAAVMLDWLLEHGRWPTVADWYGPLNTVDGKRKILLARERTRPHANTVLRIFGTWNNAKRYAGWNGAKTRTQPREEHRWSFH